MALSDRLEKIEIEKARVTGVKASLSADKSRQGDAGPPSWGVDEAPGPRRVHGGAGDQAVRQVQGGGAEDGPLREPGGALSRAGIVLPASQRPKFIAELTADLLGYGPLEELLSQPDITEIMCNGYNDIYIEKSGKLIHSDVSFTDEAHLGR